MSTKDLRRIGLALLMVGSVGAGACNGNIGGHETPTGTGGAPVGGGGPTSVKPGGVTVAPTPTDPMVAAAAVRKVENLLTGMAPTDADVALVTQQGAAGLQMLISNWMTTDPYQTALGSKMVGFFRNMFQQTGFTPTEDFKIQLLQNGGFDFGPFGVSAVGDDSYARLVQNIQDSFALTAWQLVKEGHDFRETLTTNKFVMTTGLKMVYIQIEMKADAPFGNQNATPAWTIDFSRNPIDLTTALATMNFSDEAPAHASTGFGGGSTACTAATSGTYNGTSLLFQRLIGFTPRFPFSGSPTCFEHSSKPYLLPEDVSDWTWVTINHKANPADQTPVIQPYDLPTLRNTTTLTLSLPRVGFYTTPAFLALWNTNDSNQHRVTANQTLLVALGQAFTAENTIIPFSNAGLDASHAVAGSECVGCHATLDPMRNFWANQLDYNDRNDFPARANFMGGAANPRPTSIVDEFAFGDFKATGASTADIGNYLQMVTDGNGLPRFAISVTQQLCFYANSTACSESDPEFRRVVGSFVSSNFNFAALIKEFFASPLVTGTVATGTFTAANSVPVSVTRRDHFCAALSNRLGKADICVQATTLPSTTQTATAKIAAAITTDAFSRGAQSPVTPSDPTLFYRSATEELCENIAPQVVDASTGTVYSSTDVAGSIKGMVETIMGYPPTDPLHDMAIQILTDHNTMATSAATTTGGRPGSTGGSTSKATTALRSTFVLACESPTAVGLGL
jgi:hypothetical protein